MAELNAAREKENQVFQKLTSGRYVPVGSMEEAEALRELENQIVQVELEYTKYAEQKLNFQLEREKQRAKEEKMHRLFCLGLAGVCLFPLRKGVNKKSVLRVVGMWVGCCFLSKTFRQECAKAYGNLFPDAMGRMMTNQATIAKEGTGLAIRKSYYDENAELPMIPESLAVMKIAFCKQAYVAMRETPDRIDEILSQFDVACEDLYQQGEAVGIDRRLVDKSMRKIAADLIDKDDFYLEVFTETAYDMVIRGEDTRHVQRYKENDVVKEREYMLWEGEYLDSQGQAFQNGFTPRVPESINDLRHLSKDAWDKIMDVTMSPEEWGHAVSSLYARQIQQRYFRYMQRDCGISSDALTNWNSLNQYMNPDDDVTWLVDLEGDDPFSVGSFDDTFVEIVEHGVAPDDSELHLGNYPEFKSAYGRWLNRHPSVSPMEMQRKANQCYREYENSGKTNRDLLHQVEQYIRQRDELKARWDDVFDEITLQMQQVTSDNTVRLKELKRMTRPVPGVNVSGYGL